MAGKVKTAKKKQLGTSMGFFVEVGAKLKIQTVLLIVVVQLLLFRRDGDQRNGRDLYAQ